MSQPAPFHVWMPELFRTKGGIQTYSIYFLQALQQTVADARIDVFLKHDCTITPSMLQAMAIADSENLRFHCAGSYPNAVRTPMFAAQLLGCGLQQRPKLVITTHLNFTTAAYQLWRWAKVPYWTVAHGIEAWDITRPALRSALQNADRILAVSHYTRDRLLKNPDLDPQKVVVLPNTFDADRFKIAAKPTHLLQQYGLKANQPIILTVCRLSNQERYKGYDQVLRALPIIRQTIPDIHYVIVGKGNDRARVEQQIAELNLQACVTLAGFVSDDHLSDYYSLCDVFAMPSKREGFGIVYLEALACGKPTIGGNQDGAIDALYQGEFGALVDPDHVDELADTIVKILRRSYPNALMYQPQLLRKKVIEAYGFECFQATFAKHLKDWRF